MSVLKPITIAGGGVAGLALGNALVRKGVSVELYDKGVYPRHRVCGEFICGVRENTLHKLGLDALFEDALRHTSTVWFHNSKRVLDAELPFSALGVSRYTMDKEMADSFCGAGGILNAQSSFDLSDNTPTEGIVIATGRKKERGDWIGLKMHCCDYDTAGDLEVHLGNDAYIGASSVENNRVNVCGLFRRRSGIRGKAHEVMYRYMEESGLSYLQEKMEESEPDYESYCGVSHFSFSHTLGSGRNRGEADESFGLGDQWGVIPPFTGNGMSIALETAALAVDPLYAYASGEIDWNQAISSFRRGTQRHLKTRFRVANIVQPLLLNAKTQGILASMAKRRLLPFGRLFALTHGA